ncbi:uncharacterized protein BO80DRAFT_423904 [Aspergillus ibericus CBS 121593]|uniref:Uncharacterized protein n=1 Tax=Aspergillus ibericus CBS 121593 TaxID=1448316 RepID=A0A395H8D9_9EURO|nr:hypothetical protein BO80DRAFT_423904 [Aspergillus ibericus CBS 121593]RAL02484.1 hypothetical protein BO80DRAFT_423904 [Aspergillus ibericus CBS 121593]
MPVPKFTVLPSSQLAMTGLRPPKTYTKFADLKTAILAKAEQLQTRDVTQYLSYKHVSAETFSYIETHRDALGGKVALTYFPDISTMLVKVPTPEHESVHTNVAEEVNLQCRSMRITRDEFLSLGATKYVGPTASAKEADASWINPTLRPQFDWPLLVIEAGVSESMPRLRQDFAWWISHSGGQVHIVLVIKVTRTTKTVVLEKYIPKQAVYPRTRARAALPPVYVPDRVSITTVDHGVSPPTVEGDRVILEFERVIGRPPVPPERDIDLTPAILIDATRFVFRR